MPTTISAPTTKILYKLMALYHLDSEAIYTEAGIHKSDLTNIKKRQIKSPKIYFRDSGILHKLMGVECESELLTHIKCGASWEGFALEQILSASSTSYDECFFWGVHEQGEIDLLIKRKGKLKAYEFKYTSSPKITKSMSLALNTLPIDELVIVAPVEAEFPLNDQIRVMSIGAVVASP